METFGHQPVFLVIKERSALGPASFGEEVEIGNGAEVPMLWAMKLHTS